MKIQEQLEKIHYKYPLHYDKEENFVMKKQILLGMLEEAYLLGMSVKQEERQRDMLNYPHEQLKLL